MSQEWAEQRTEAARVHAERLRARQDAEHAQADQLLREFASAAAQHGLEAEALRVKGYGGGSTARTHLRGWYLRQDRSAGVSTAGDFYVLTAPLGLLDRVRGVRPEPSKPPLVLGAGGRDGDSIDLAVALERLLSGWRGR